MYMIVPIIWKLDATRAQKWRYHFPCTMALYLQYHEVHDRQLPTVNLWLLLIIIHCRNILSIGGSLYHKEATLTMYQNWYPRGYTAAH